MKNIKMYFAITSIFFISITNTAFTQTPTFKQLQCQDVGWFTAFFNVKATNEKIVFEDGKHAGGNLLKKLLTRIPDNLFRAYKCFNYTLTVPADSCQFNPKFPELTQCSSKNLKSVKRASLKVRAAATSCVLDNNAGYQDYYNFEVTEWNVHMAHQNTTDGYDQPVAGLETNIGLTALNDIGEIDVTRSAIRTLHYLGEWTPADGCCAKKPTCKLDGEHLFRELVP